MKNKKPLVNIIILNWNNYEDTKECLESINKIDYINWGVTLIDNGSNDGSVEKLVSFCKNNKKVKILLNKENKGFAEGNNLGIRESLKNKRYDYFLLLNNDTIVERNFLRNLLNEMEKNKKIGVSSPLVFNYYSRNEISIIDSPGRFNFKNGGGEPWFKNLEELSRRTPFYVDYTCGSCWLIRRDILKGVGLFNEKFFAYFEEIDLAMRIQKLGFKFMIVPKSKIWHKGAVTSNKITGFKLYLMTRNMIWVERIHATNREFLIFLFKFFTLKFLKNIIKIMIQKNRILNINKFFTAIIDGFFEKKKIFNSPKNYKL